MFLGVLRVTLKVNLMESVKTCQKIILIFSLILEKSKLDKNSRRQNYFKTQAEKSDICRILRTALYRASCK